MTEKPEQKWLEDVFIVTEEIDYEPGDILAAFSTREKAFNYVKTKVDESRREITYIRTLTVDLND